MKVKNTCVKQLPSTLKLTDCCVYIFNSDDFTDMFLEEKHFEFLQAELLAVESKLNVLSAGGGVASTLSIVRTDVHGDVNLGIKEDAVASSTSFATGDNTVSRMSFWN